MRPVGTCPVRTRIVGTCLEARSYREDAPRRNTPRKNTPRGVFLQKRTCLEARSYKKDAACSYRTNIEKYKTENEI
jgi:hypothetical protein